jgi:hypothetical protein
METKEYLDAILKEQDLADDSDEMDALRRRRKAVKELLEREFPDAESTIRYGGSIAKGTLIRENYDLDLTFYVPSGNNTVGDTLQEIYGNTATKLKNEYVVQRKTSALRLKNKEQEDFHIDVIPGRYTDDEKSDTFIYQQSAEKCRLKTNLQTHIDHIRDSGVIPAIRLLKLWKARKALRVKQFVFELMIVDLLKEKKDETLAVQFEHVLVEIKDSKDPIPVEDPANPTGNDLTFTTDIWSELQTAAQVTLDQIRNTGYEGAFGPLQKKDKAARVTALKSAAAAVVTPARSWGEK